MTRREVLEEIEELQTAPLTMVNAKRLAILYILRDNLGDAGRSSNAGKQHQPFSMDLARQWVSSLKNADGSTGPHWSFDETRQIQNQYNVLCDAATFYAVTNSLFSDFDPVLRKFNVSSPEFYAMMAKSWIEDKDAVSDKTTAYWENIVRH